MHHRFVRIFWLLILCAHQAFSQQAAKPLDSSSSTTSSISSNPAAVNVTTGSGALQRYIEQQWNIEDNHGVTLQGAWMGDTNKLFSGGITNAKTTTSNSVGLLSLAIDMERFNGWQGGLFNVQFLQQNAQNTNGQAGLFQGYNSLPDIAPFNRSELYALWYRQEFFDKHLFIRLGKTITTLDFNNVVKPVPLAAGNPNIPAVTGLIYTPIFISPAVDGIMPGYTNSAYGVTATILPFHNWYLSYGGYDGNLAQGRQTGLNGPTFNGNYFQVGEVGNSWILGKYHKPGTVGVGAWHQTGLILQRGLREMGASGGYVFGSQRLWYQHPGMDTKGVSIFYQYGVNNSSALSMKRSIGAGLTYFSPFAHREDDSLGAGFSYAWLNPQSTDRAQEMMYQVYYQAKVLPIVYLEPALSYIPTPGQSSRLSRVLAGTLRAILLF